MRNKYDLYISYSRANHDTARTIADLLQRQGYSCFVDFNSLDSGTFEEQIFVAINSSSCFVLLYSQHVDSSQFIRREVEFALENDIKIIPILLSEFKDVSWYKDRFATINCIRLCDGGLSSEASDKLLQNIRTILGESEIEKHFTASSSESMLNYAPSREKNTEIHHQAPINGAHYKRGCIIFFVILSAIIGLGIFIFTCFTSLYTASGESGGYNDNYTSFLALSFVVFISCSLAFYYHQRCKRKNVKITCNKSAIINVDGIPIAKLEAHNVLFIHLSKGIYIIDFQLISDKSKHKIVPLTVSKVTEDSIAECEFPSLLNEKNTIKVFIAGSTRLVAERDALRSVIGQMYNRYKEDNLLIEAYSFDDFSREFTEGGHQKLYDEFIRQEANWVVFITDGDMGEKTIWELENAINAYKSDKRPKILMYSKLEKTQSSLQMSSFKKLLFEENQYWIDYSSLDDIKTSFRDHLHWDLYNLMKSQYKKIC